MQSAFDSAVLFKVAIAIQWATRIDPAFISPTTRLVEDLALSRFARLRLAICLEQAFDDELSDDDLAGLVRVGDIVRHFSHRVFRDYAYPIPAFAA